jgi:NAD(P)-dependent dehydrogenase (short-subunit alcohol dehydrogenase family)
VASRAAEVGNGQVDMLINNAGVFPFGPTHDTTEDVFDRVYALPPTLGTIVCGQTTALDI